jgi:hypothetical protein
MVIGFLFVFRAGTALHIDIDERDKRSGSAGLPIPVHSGKLVRTQFIIRRVSV